MFAKLRPPLSFLALLAILAACAPAPAVDLPSPSPTAVADLSATPQATAETLPIPVSPSFDCETVQEIPVEECAGLVALYKSTDGDNWADHSDWLADQTPCDWYGLRCEQGHVVELQLFYNDLNGSLPPEIGNFALLQSLYLDDNQLSGPLPAEIGKLSELVTARLGGNQFDSLPPELFTLNKLSFLELWGNHLRGEIPGEIGTLSSLQDLNLSSNEFTGGIPAELGNLAFLHTLVLSHNQLSGPIPTTLGELKSLNQLDLSFNQLSGVIPAELAELTDLYLLDLSYNQLTGAVPESIANGPIAERRLWGNLFEDTIPAAEGAVTSVDFQEIHFEFDSSLAGSVWPERVPAQVPDPSEPGWLSWPEHARFTFTAPSEPGGFEAGKSTGFGPPQIVIYPTRAYSTMSEFARTEIEELQALLRARPTVIENEIPALPLINAAQVFHGQVKYLDFQNGAGVRFITQYSQDVSPITNQNLFYTFQGLTADGAYYVAAFFPVTADGLPNEPVVDDWDAFSSNYEDYLAETVSQLDALASTGFAPDLEILDQLIQTLEVGTP